MGKNLSIRPDVDTAIRVAVQERLATLRRDPEFRARLHEEFERNRELVERLSGT